MTDAAYKIRDLSRKREGPVRHPEHRHTAGQRLPFPMTYPLRLRAGGTPAATMAKGSFNEQHIAIAFGIGIESAHL